jgi:signal transduction histidine kinase
MKKTVFLLLLLTIVLKLAGQEVLIKKLENQLAKPRTPDSFTVNRLNQLAQLYDVPISRRDSVARESLELSRKINYRSGEAIALISLALVYNEKGETQMADSLSQHALSIAEKLGEPWTLAQVLKGMGSYKSFASEAQIALRYFFRAEAISQKNNYTELLSLIQAEISGVYSASLSDYPRALEWALKSLKTAETTNCLNCMEVAWTTTGQVYDQLGDEQKSLEYFKKALEADKKMGNKTKQAVHSINIGERYRLTGQYENAIKSYQEGLALAKSLYLIGLIKSDIADAYVKLGNLPLGLEFAFSARDIAQKIGDTEGEAWIAAILGRAYLKKNNPDSALYYAIPGLAAARETGTLEFMRDNYEVLAKAYAQKKDFAQAYNYQALYFNYRDSMLNKEVSNKSNLLQYNYDLEKKQAQIAALNQQKKLQRFFLIAALVVLVMIIILAIILYRNNRQKHKANILLSNQKELIEKQRNEADRTLQQLRRTQAHLIQSEKMASLGELTAGIAHEIQNPLNFINNFSELNKELLLEMKDEIEKRNMDAVKSIAKDVISNQEKINHHGKRADTIVKGMLQHSRSSTGAKEPTEINKLVEEYSRLAYHGLRAKNKSFNATLQTSYDETIGNIDVIPQEIGRVILNLVTNAFYAVTEKSASLSPGQQYEPTVIVNTKAFKPPSGGLEVLISVKDNGNGIPQKVVDKIFQPFFTTKPTGQGTGLGLSLSYDIVKAHGGELKVETKESEGAEFIIQLPATT